MEHIETDPRSLRPPEPPNMVRAGFEAVMGDPEHARIDVRDYLLDPPPTPEQLELLERRRLLVRRASLVIAGLVAVLLVAPWPSGTPGAPPAPTADPAAAAQADPAPPPPRGATRLDLPRRRAKAPIRRTTAVRAAAPPPRPASPSRRARSRRPTAPARAAPSAPPLPRPVPAAVATPAPAPVAAPAPPPPPPAPRPAPRPEPAPAAAPPTSGDAAVLVPVL